MTDTSDELIKELHIQSRLTIEELKNVISRFFSELGFEKIKCNAESIVITRGSDFKNGLTNNPIKWKSRIIINFKLNSDVIEVSSCFNISTKHQIVTEKELNVWIAILSVFENMIETGTYDLGCFFDQLKRTRKASRNIILWTIAGTLLSAPLGLYLALTFELRILIPVIVILGALTFLKIGIKRNK
jgi:hypothetical protein